MIRLTHKTCVAKLVTATAVSGALAAVAGMPAQAQSVETQKSVAVDEIVVTAQRRAQRLEDVPITVTAVSGEKLAQAGVSATGQLNEVVPAFRMDHNAVFAQPTIRGVSTALAGVGGGSAVGVYVDNFYNPSPLTADFEFLNVSSIQVVKGPQGTLFGRNTTAGAVLVTTMEPGDQPQFQAKASYARFNTVDLGAYASAPLTDSFAVDVAGLYKSGEGFMTNLTDGDDKIGRFESYSVRLGAKYSFGGSNYFFARYTHSRREDPQALIGSIYKDNKIGRYWTVGEFIPGAVWGKDNRHMATEPGVRPFFESRTNIATLTGKFDLGFATLTTLSQYKVEKSLVDNEDIDGTSIPALRIRLPFKDKLKTQEVLLNSTSGGRLDWVTGLFYMQQVASSSFSILAPAIGKQVGTHINIKSIAGFVDTTYEAIDNLFLTVGARYGHEKANGYWECFGPAICRAGPDPYLLGRHYTDASWNNFSPRAVVRYDLGGGANVYASVTRGYKSGVLDLNGYTKTPIAPEKLTAYEAGFKAALGRTRLAASAFYYDYKDLQVSLFDNLNTITANAASSEIYGAEASFTQKVAELTFSGGLAYTHGRYKSYKGAPNNLFNFGQLTNPPPSSIGQIDNSASDASGNHMARSPTWSGNIGVDYVVEVMGGALNLNGNLYYTSKIFFDPTNNNWQNAYALLNLRATWTDPTEKWSIALWGNNVTDKAYKEQVFANTVAATNVWAQPATYGVTVQYKY